MRPLTLFLVLLVPGLAQTVPPVAPPPLPATPTPAGALAANATESDPIQEELKAIVAPSPGDEQQTPAQDQGGRDRAKRRQADRFLRMADRAKAFQAKHASKPVALEAKSLEAQSLLSAALADDSAPDARASALVAEIRVDKRISAKKRLDVVGLAEVARLQPLRRHRERFLAESEVSVRNLITEFPQESAGYEALFRLAESQSDDAKGVALAQELMTLPAPAPVKEMAQVFLDRQALVGRSLPLIANAALGTGNEIAAVKGKPLIVYSWASWDPGSVAYAKGLAKLAPPQAVLIGVNLDKDVAAAQALAQSESLPLRQLYDERGLDSPLARALKLGSSFHVYVTNRVGEIRDVTAERGDLGAKFGSANR